MAGDWSDEQNDAIVADYFAMLADDIAGRLYSKAEHNRLLRAMIDRPRGSVEYKHQNISAVLKGLGEVWIPGYKPAFICRLGAGKARRTWKSPRSWERGTISVSIASVPTSSGQPGSMDGFQLMYMIPSIQIA